MNKTDPSTDPLTALTEPTIDTATTPRFPPCPVVGGGTVSPHSCYHCTTPFIPPEPMMGGVAQVKDDEYSAWTSVKPNHLWTCLNSSAPCSYVEATQLMGMKATSGLEECSSGFTTKFSLGHDVTNFQKKAFELFKCNGMDTITYLPDLANNMNMVNVIKDHTHFM